MATKGSSSVETAAGIAGARKQDVAESQAKSKEFDFSADVEKLRETFRSGKTKDLEWRREQLKQTRAMLTENIDAFADAITADLGRHKNMSVFGDMTSCIHSCDLYLENLDKYSARRYVSTQPELYGAKAFRLPEPKGVCLNIAPWNFPIELLVSPLAAMIAAGNCVVVKPSEISANCEKLLCELIPKYLDTTAVQVISGGVPETTALLKQKFDHILYTGNGFVGKIVMTAAAQHLCPVTLELGGKSPAIIDETANIPLAAKRIANIKTLNCGQICVCPDYVLIHKSVEAQFYEEFKKALKEFYPEGQENSKSYARIVNHNHWRRLAGLLEDHGGEVVIGGLDKCDEQSKLFVTTVVKNPDLDSKVMSEEIFGPLLPVVSVSSLKVATGIINARAHPLALYIFSQDKKNTDYLLANTHSGGACVNDALMHLLVDGLPFGGVGGSGMGLTHGQAGFDEFSHLRSVLDRGTGTMDLLASARYAPFKDDGYGLMKKIAQAGPLKAKIGKVLAVLKYAVPVAAAAIAARFLGYY